MTWLDVLLIVLLIVFMALGARFGSLWTASCAVGGFFGAWLVDFYALPVASMMGAFPGSNLLAAVLLFTAGLAIALVPGWVLGRLVKGLFLGIFDSAFGFVAGLLVGLCAVTLLLLAVVPQFPRVERSRAWKRSSLVRPLNTRLEDLFHSPHFRSAPIDIRLREEVEDRFSPMAERARKNVTKTVKEKAADWVSETGK